ncbi:response regulator [Paramagnetospirillum magneticum]|uniref:Response regulator consisting of a CheY-like receiver domain and a winged-helix DNA-binding domain n=1 Tax=Paramagnetospirillum magneticum (strain ATCC 700264 / AMB-1) TaxID=342108 RepID=Q2W608_PARM1|nr:response regulator transcription factor [Paramagnetospirillum magneticum]BAE50717.1 Response regulator consisting of a CheY-like receiver domain and a winged-helix DNA-binding domain [Paramagnetospirillum magneticum AMB-1]
MSRILVVDDEPQIRKFLRISLAANGYEVAEAESGAAGLQAFRAACPDLLILDLGLPDMDGQEIISAVRQDCDIPIIVLSVRAQELDKVEALDRGANDYVTKPFGVAELMARVRAVLRPHLPKEGGQVVESGSLKIDLDRLVVRKAGSEIHLSRKEWDLLAFFARHPDHVLTHKHILKGVWGPAHVDDTAYLRVYVNQLRQKLEDDPARPRLIVTDPGVGYRLRSDPQP